MTESRIFMSTDTAAVITADITTNMTAAATSIVVQELLEHFQKRLWKADEETADISEELMSGYDLEMCLNTGKLIRKLFGNDPGGYFLRRSKEERRYLCSQLVCELGKLYGIALNTEDAPGSGVLYFDKKSLLCGIYSRVQNIFFLNLAYLSSQDSGMIKLFIENLIHEYRHAVQLKAVHTPGFWNVSVDRASLWKQNYDNYQTAERNPVGYYEQLVELDARTFSYLSMKGF